MGEAVGLSFFEELGADVVGPLDDIFAFLCGF